MNSACDLRGLKIHSAMKNYTSAPLPFMGQKKRFIREFRKALREFDHATVFVDLFGGSGLLSHVTKRERPDARVIYNDFDDYHVRLENIDQTNALLADIRTIVGEYPKKDVAGESTKEYFGGYTICRTGRICRLHHAFVRSIVFIQIRYGLCKPANRRNVQQSSSCSL